MSDSITNISCDDYETLYVNGKIWSEDHSHQPNIWFKLGQQFPNVSWNDIEHIYLNDKQIEILDYTYPDNLSDLKEALNI